MFSAQDIRKITVSSINQKSVCYILLNALLLWINYNDYMMSFHQEITNIVIFCQTINIITNIGSNILIVFLLNGFDGESKRMMNITIFMDRIFSFITYANIFVSILTIYIVPTNQEEIILMGSCIITIFIAHIVSMALLVIKLSNSNHKKLF